MSTGWNYAHGSALARIIINLLGNEYWLEQHNWVCVLSGYYKPTGK